MSFSFFFWWGRCQVLTFSARFLIESPLQIYIFILTYSSFYFFIFVFFFLILIPTFIVSHAGRIEAYLSLNYIRKFVHSYLRQGRALKIRINSFLHFRESKFSCDFCSIKLDSCQITVFFCNEETGPCDYLNYNPLFSSLSPHDLRLSSLF